MQLYFTEPIEKLISNQPGPRSVEYFLYVRSYVKILAFLVARPDEMEDRDKNRKEKTKLLQKCNDENLNIVLSPG